MRVVVIGCQLHHAEIESAALRAHAAVHSALHYVRYIGVATLGSCSKQPLTQPTPPILQPDDTVQAEV